MTPEAIRTLLFGLSRKDFWDPGLGRGLLKGHKFRALFKQHLPVNKVEDCRYPLALSVYDKEKKETFVITEGAKMPFMFLAPCLFYFSLYGYKIA